MYRYPFKLSSNRTTTTNIFRLIASYTLARKSGGFKSQNSDGICMSDNQLKFLPSSISSVMMEKASGYRGNFVLPSSTPSTRPAIWRVNGFAQLAKVVPNLVKIVVGFGDFSRQRRVGHRQQTAAASKQVPPFPRGPKKWPH